MHASQSMQKVSLAVRPVDRPILQEVHIPEAANLPLTCIFVHLYRLDDRLFRQELRERGQELKQLGRPINTPDGQIRWRVLMPGPRLLHVQRLTRVLVPHVAQLIADAEAHPGFTKAMPNGEQLHSRLLDVNPLIAPSAQVRCPHRAVSLLSVVAVSLASLGSAITRDPASPMLRSTI